MYIYVWVCAHACRCPRNSVENTRSPGARVVGACELPHMGARNQARVVYGSRAATHPPTYPPPATPAMFFWLVFLKIGRE